MNRHVALTIAQDEASSRAALLRPHDPVRALYIHIPFCFHKCHYCDFYSFVDTQDRQATFVECLVQELDTLAPHAARAPQGGLASIFVGGGTPSLLAVPLWETLLQALHARWAISASTEFTVECNPETVTPALMRILASGGVNRVSVGAQSFDSAHLKTLERWHDPASVGRALAMAHDAGIARRSLDLIFGVPGQTLDHWRQDLTAALALSERTPLEHVSCYGLTYEPNTAMTRRLQRGEFIAIDEDLEADMYIETVRALREHGLERYEVSNFARPGAECRHNLAYWRQEQWLAAGPSGSAHVAGQRWKNIPRLSDWMEGVSASGGYSPVVDLEGPDDRRAIVELIMTTIRLREGVDAARVLASVNDHSKKELTRIAQRYEVRGCLTRSSDRWTLSDDGFLLADLIASELMAAVQASGA